jgi:uncharacterized protein YyaL (SSP411 family)
VSRFLATAVSALVLPLPSHATLVADRAQALTLAEQGLAQTQGGWWDAKAGWYRDQTIPGSGVATLWSSYPALELTAAVAIADPTPENKAAVDTLFGEAEAFWDPTLGAGSGGVSYLPGLRYTGVSYFDDAGWWGIAYLDAYRATGKTRWLSDAGRALSYIDAFGWDKVSGGMWWDSGHGKKTSEPLAAATLIAATLYRIQHRPYYLTLAKKYLAWADANTLNHAQGDLYGRNATDGTVMDYVEGMMVSAHAQLCAGTGQQTWCDQAENIARASLTQFPLLADWEPQSDVIYLRGLLDLYASDRDSQWYAVAYANEQAAVANARDDSGLWSRMWDGRWASYGALFTQAGTLELLAWVAATQPPGS